MFEQMLALNMVWDHMHSGSVPTDFYTNLYIWESSRSCKACCVWTVAPA